MSAVEHHDCQPPTEDRPIDAAKQWTCPECGDVWEVESLGSTHPARTYDFAKDQYTTPATWKRIGQP
jgi:acetone carboxylase gamma subunit